MATLQEMLEKRTKEIEDEGKETPDIGSGLAMGFMALGDAISGASGASTNYLGSYLRQRAADKKAKRDSKLTPMQLATLIQKKKDRDIKFKREDEKELKSANQKTIDSYIKRQSSARNLAQSYIKRGDKIPAKIKRESLGIFVNKEGQLFKPLEGGKLVSQLTKKKAVDIKNKVNKKEKQIIEKDKKTPGLKSPDTEEKKIDKKQDPVFEGSVTDQINSRKFYEVTGKVVQFSNMNDKQRKDVKEIVDEANKKKEKAKKSYPKIAIDGINSFLSIRDAINKSLYRAVNAQLGGIPENFSYRKNIINDGKNLYYTATSPDGITIREKIELPGMWGAAKGFSETIGLGGLTDWMEERENDPGYIGFKQAYNQLTVEMLNKISGAAVSEKEYERFASIKEGVGKNPIKAIEFLNKLEDQVTKDITYRYNEAQQEVSGATGHKKYSDFLKEKYSPKALLRGYGIDTDPDFMNNFAFSLEGQGKDGKDKSIDTYYMKDNEKIPVIGTPDRWRQFQKTPGFKEYGKGSFNKMMFNRKRWIKK